MFVGALGEGVVIGAVVFAEDVVGADVGEDVGLFFAAGKLALVVVEVGVRVVGVCEVGLVGEWEELLWVEVYL